MSENQCDYCKGDGMRLRWARDIHPAMNVAGWTPQLHRQGLAYKQICKACAGTGYRPAETSGVPLVTPPVDPAAPTPTRA